MFAQEGKDSARRVDFESAEQAGRRCRQKLKAMAEAYQFKAVGDVVLDEEHQTYSVSFTDAQGAVRKIDWALATAAGEPADAGQACADQGASWWGRS